jgi:hypothetical protein
MPNTVTRKPPCGVLWGNLGWHPAVRAWRAFAGGAAEPDTIEVLRNGKKSATHRLVGVGPAGESIIAQRMQVAKATIEREMYEHILPRVPVTAPRYYGTRQDGDGFAWLFLEDVGDERITPTDPAHLALAGRWVALMHTAAVDVAAARRLPDAGPSRYLEHLQVDRQTIVTNLANPALAPSDAALLRDLVRDLDRLERGWGAVTEACAGMPATLVHGDLQRKNMYIRQRPGGTELFPIDWETAGWGVPAADLPRIDLPTYASVVRAVWPTVELEDVRRLAVVGRIFLELVAIRWVSPQLAYEAASFLTRPMSWLRVMHERLAAALRDLGDLT